MESVSFIQGCLDNLNYWTITLLMTIESSFIPFPSEIVVPPAAYKAAAGELNVYLVVLFSTLGACMGAMINYSLSLLIGRPLVYKFMESRLGHILMLSSTKMEKAEHYFNKHGIISTLIGRLIPAIRQLISIPAGLSRMKLSTFLLFTFLGAGLWNAILAAIGYSLHAIVPQDQLMDNVYKYSHEIGYIFIGLGVLLVGFLIYKGHGRKASK